ncbi:c-type cytochrome [Aliiroseovarius salicola]
MLFLNLNEAQAGPQKQPEGSDPASGAVLYAENCASCHGDNLQGEPNWRSQKEDGTLPAPPHDKTGHTWHHGDALLFSYTKLGGQAALEASGVSGFNSGMPGFAEVLNDQEIWDILAYIKSTWPDRMRETQQVRTQGEQMKGGS